MCTEINIAENAFIHCLSIEITNNIRENNSPNISSICFQKRISASLKEIHKESKIFEIRNIDAIHKCDIENSIDINLRKIVKRVINKIIDATPDEKLARATKNEVKSALKKSFRNSNNIENALERLKNISNRLENLNDTYQKAKIFSDNYQTEKNKLTKSSGPAKMQNFKKKCDLIVFDLPITLDLLSIEEKTILKTQYKITEKEIKEIKKPLFEERFAVCIKLQDTINKLFEKLDRGFALKEYENFTPPKNQTAQEHTQQLSDIKDENDIEVKKEIKEKLQNLFILMKSAEGAKYREKHSMEVFALADRASSIGIKIDTGGN